MSIRTFIVYPLVDGGYTYTPHHSERVKGLAYLVSAGNVYAAQRLTDRDQWADRTDRYPEGILAARYESAAHPGRFTYERLCGCRSKGFPLLHGDGPRYIRAALIHFCDTNDHEEN